MSRHLFNSPIGAFIAPLGVPKCIGLGAAALAAGIAATASTGATLYNNWQANLASDKQFNRTKDLMDKQQEQNIALHKANLEESYRQDLEYNNPSAQMQRYREAGLNPYLQMQDGNVGAGVAPQSVDQGASSPSAQLQQTFPMSAPDMSGLSQLLATQSQVKVNEADAFSRIADSIPKVGETLGWENARYFARELLGVYGIHNSQRERQLDAIIDNYNYSAEYNSLQNQLIKRYGFEKASNDIALQEQLFNKYAAEIGLMSSEGKLNDAKVEELASEYVRNLADAFKLRKEGNYYVASSEQYEELSKLTHLSVVRAGIENRLGGFYEGSPLDDYSHKYGHQRRVVEATKIGDIKSSNVFYNAADVVLGKWIKVSN